MASTVVMSQYPLMEGHLSEVAVHATVDTEYLIVSHIVYSGYLNLIRQMRQIKCENLIVFFPASQSRIMAPIFRIMALLISARTRFVLNAGSAPKKWSGYVIFGDLFSIFWSFVTGLFVAIFAGLYFLAINRKRRTLVDFAGHARSKRVLYLRPILSQGLKSGGVVSHSRGVISGLLKNGYSVDCIIDDAIIDIPQNMGTTTIVPPVSSYVLPRELNSFNYQCRFISFLMRKFDRAYTGIIYQRLSIGGFAGVVLSRLWGAPLVLEFNGSEIWLAKNWGKRLLLERLSEYIEQSILKHAHLIVTVSDALRRELMARGIDDTSIVVCPNGVDPIKFTSGQLSASERKAERRKFGIKPDDVVFTFVGSFGVWHGGCFLADTIKDLLNAPGVPSADKCKFLMVGSGVELSTVEERLKDEIEQGRVIITGATDQDAVPTLLEISDVCLVTTIENFDGSEFFGSPTKFFEYIAAGRPVVASAVGQIAEIMQSSFRADDLSNAGLDTVIDIKHLGDGIGVLFDAGNSLQLKAAILALAQDAVARKAMGRNARSLAIEKYTWVQHVRRFMDAFDSVVMRLNNYPVRVMLNALHAKSGGGGTYLHNMLPILSALPEIEVHVVLHRSQEKLFSSVLANVTTYYIETEGSLARTIFFEQFGLPRLARKIAADVLFSSANYGPLMITNGVILLRNSLYVATVERRMGKLLYWGLVYIATMLSLLTARRAIAVSEYAGSSAIQGLFRGLRRKMTIVPHGVSSVYIKNKRTVAPKPFLLTVSDIYVQKNLHTLIRGFAGLLDDMPDLVLKVAGKPLDASYYARVCKIIDELGIADSVEFLGHVGGKDLVSLYGSCTVFVFPSTVETFGNPLVEAMASGCPIVCAHAAAMPEIAGDAVRYVLPHEPNSFTMVLREMLMDEAMRKDFSARARARSKIYSWEITARRTTNVLVDSVRRK